MTTRSPVRKSLQNAPRADVRHLVTIPALEWPHGFSFVQGVQWYAYEGKDRWVVARALKAPGGREHTVLHRHREDGSYIDSCIAMYAGHPSSFAVQLRGNDVRVLLRWNGPGGGHIHWMVYRAKRRWPNQHRVHPVKLGVVAPLPAADETFETLVARTRRDEDEVYRVYDFDAVRQGNRSPREVFVYRPSGVFQGHTTDGKHVYALYGWRDEWSWIEKRTVAGDFVGAVDVTHCRKRDTSFEIEGIGWRKGELMVGMREGGADKFRTTSVWAVDQAGFSRWKR